MDHQEIDGPRLIHYSVPVSWQRNHRTAPNALLMVLAAVGVAVLVMWNNGALPGQLAPEDQQHAAVQEPAMSPLAGLPGQADPERKPVAEQSPPQPFTSKLADGDDPDPNPLRDGIVVIVRHPSGSPCAEMPITVQWRKGFGLYGEDRGLTTRGGGFATTVKTVDQFEGIALAHPEYGKLENHQDLLLWGSEPPAVLLIVPELVSANTQVLDLDDNPVAGAIVALSSTPNRPPGEFQLAAQPAAAITDRWGRATVRMPPGQCTGEAKRTGFSQIQTLATPITRNGDAVTLRMIDHDKRREVTIFATAPAGIEISKVYAFSQPLDESLAARLHVEIDSGQRQFEVEKRGDHYTARVDPLPWRAVATADGCNPGIKDLPDYQPTVHLTLHRKPPPAPKASLEVTVTHPDGTPAPGAEVWVHRAPDIIYGPKNHAGEGGRFVFDGKPGLRVCASATMRGYSRAIGGPVQLSRGKTMKIALQLRAALPLRGLVVDKSGKPVTAQVALHRPAEALRALGEDVPMTLVGASTNDWTGTGPDGEFSYDNLYPGPHAVWAYPEGNGWPGRATARPGEDIRVVVGEGLEGYALVTMVARETDTDAVISECHLVPEKYEITDGVGRYALVPQNLELLVSARDRVVTHWGPQFVGAGPHSITIEMARSDPVFVRVVDSGGQPIVDAEVHALDRDGKARELTNIRGQPIGEYVRSNRAGRAQLMGLPSGELRLRIEHDGTHQEFILPADGGRASTFELRWR